MATVACELHHADDRFDWTAFYRVTAPGLLKIGPYQGGHGCLTIPFDRGVCGAAARSGETQLVPDVEVFPGHIACAASTGSELVIPLRDSQGEVFAVLDIDSDRPDAFAAEDAERLEALMDQPSRRGGVELGYVLEGWFEIWVGGRHHALGPGDSFWARDEDISWLNPHDTPCAVV